MSLSFTGGDADRVNHGSDASLDNLDPITCLAWAWMDTDAPGGNRQICTKDGADTLRIIAGWDNTNASFWMETPRAGGSIQVLADAAQFTHFSDQKWCCYIFRMDTGGAAGDQEILIGDLSNAPTEPAAYRSQLLGGGLKTTDAANSIIGGNRSLVNISWPGDIAWMALFERYMTDGEAWSQLRKIGSPIYPAALFCHYGYNGVNSQRDLSGNSNHGTVTTAVQSSHVPLGPFWGWDTWPPAYNVVPVGASIMNQFQYANLGADLFNGTMLI